MAKKLIAAVATAVMVAGVRTVVQPGEELPEMSKHDEAEALASGTAVDPALIDRKTHLAAAAEKQAKKDFDESRKAVVAQQDSVKAANAEAEAAAEAKAAEEKAAADKAAADEAKKAKK